MSCLGFLLSRRVQVPFRVTVRIKRENVRPSTWHSAELLINVKQFYDEHYMLREICQAIAEAREPALSVGVAQKGSLRKWGWLAGE